MRPGAILSISDMASCLLLQVFLATFCHGCFQVPRVVKTAVSTAESIIKDRLHNKHIIKYINKTNNLITISGVL